MKDGNDLKLAQCYLPESETCDGNPIHWAQRRGHHTKSEPVRTHPISHINHGMGMTEAHDYGTLYSKNPPSDHISVG